MATFPLQRWREYRWRISGTNRCSSMLAHFKSVCQENFASFSKNSLFYLEKVDLHTATGSVALIPLMRAYLENEQQKGTPLYVPQLESRASSER